MQLYFYVEIPSHLSFLPSLIARAALLSQAHELETACKEPYSLSSSDAPFRSATTSAAAFLISSISLVTDPPSSTEAVALVSPWPLVVVGVAGVAGVADSSASRRSTSFLALAMFYLHVS